MTFALQTAMGPRENLEDIALATQCTDALSGTVATLLGVFDGAGGEPKGEVARSLGAMHCSSHVAWNVTMNGLHDSTESPNGAMTKLLSDALIGANEAILEAVAKNSNLQGMATTAVCAMVVHDRLYVSWAGDSRCYVHSATGLRCVTRDHTKIAAAIAAKTLTAVEARHHPDTHVITQYLGKQMNFLPDVQSCALAPNDLVVLCSDGLTDVLTDKAIEISTAACRDGRLSIHEIPGELVSRALSCGTTDNTTVLCYHHAPTSQPLKVFDARTRTGDYELELALTLGQIGKEF